MEELIKTAAAQLGVKEVPGIQGNNPQIVKFAQEAGFPTIRDDETAWCSVFMNWVAKESGYERSKSALARSWLNTGMTIIQPEPGDVVVYWRVDRHSIFGHVGLFMGYSVDHTRIYTLGGNQGNAVSISAYKAEQVLGFRRLRKIGAINLPNVVLKKGSKGKQVSQLQDILKSLGFNCGTSDGDFGSLTEAAVMDLQSTSDDLEINGIVDKKTREFIEELLKLKNV
ncbi:MAG: hypothetical protein DHS20C18_38500 [Saprospiraceae bacterium]|nr:MAG: hypothetical protein DHS20C18_38500 [Saprospiraceae bacterium]